MKTERNIEILLKSLKEEGAPAESFRTNARIRIINTVISPRPFHAGWYQRPRVWGYTFGSAIATVVLSLGTVYAAQSSLPASTLYPVKVLSERVALTLSPTQSIKTTVASSIISRRVEEIEKVREKGNQEEIDQSIEHFDEDVSSLQKNRGISRTEIDSEIEEHNAFVNTLRKKRGDKERDEESSQTITPTQQPKIEDSLPTVEGVTTRHNDD